MSFVFMGTPEFSTIILDHLEEAGYVPALTVTQPDRPCGRGQKLQASPVAIWSAQRGIQTLKPYSARAPELQEVLESIQPDFVLTAAYGQVLPGQILSAPKKGCLNIHASLLPKYRGASPVQSAILAGESESGVSLMLMDQGLDTGPILAQSTLPLTEEITASELNLELAHLGGRLLVEVLPAFLADLVLPQPQDASRASLTRLLRKSDGEIDFSQTARDVHNHIRAMNDWPGAFAFLNKKRYKIIRAKVHDEADLSGAPGELHVIDRRMFVACGGGVLELLEIQPQSGTAMSCAVCSHNFTDGSVFDPCSRLNSPID